MTDNHSAENNRLAEYFYRRSVELLEQAKAENDPIRRLDLEKGGDRKSRFPAGTVKLNDIDGGAIMIMVADLPAMTDAELRGQFRAGVAERLKLTRHLLNLSEEQAAAGMLVSLRTYRKWERGEPHRDNVMGVLAFCEKYGVSYGWLFGGPDYAPPPRFRLRLVS